MTSAAAARSTSHLDSDVLGKDGTGKLCIDSLNSLDTVANDRLNEITSEVDSISEEENNDDIRSDGPEPSVIEAEVHLNDLDADDGDVESILDALGFADRSAVEALLPASTASTAPATGADPPRRRNLFWRQYTAVREPRGRLTAARLAAHEKAQSSGAKAHSASAVWLGNFKTSAKMVPVTDLATQVIGYGLGEDVAGFLGGDGLDSQSERLGSAVDVDDAASGCRVVGFRSMRLSAGMAHGRATFLNDDEVSIATPDCSSAFSDNGGEDVDVGVFLNADEEMTSQQRTNMAFSGRS